MSVIAFQVLPLFALSLGASVTQLGQITALFWITDVMQFFIAPEVARHSKQRWMGVGYLLAAVITIGYLFVPLMYAARQAGAAVTLLMLVVAAYNVILSLGLAAWSPYVREMIPLKATGHFLGVLQSAGSAVILAGGVLAGLFLGSNPELWKFTVVFGVAIAAVFVRAVLIISLPSDGAALFSDQIRRRWQGLFVPLRDVRMRSFVAVVFWVLYT